ncbi:MAG TPA: biopolymer transporter TolR [Cyclobacteriaceae bacterium]|nr:biopolymer transporter TolR [Cyclobacteriaceae bacterium]
MKTTLKHLLLLILTLPVTFAVYSQDSSTGIFKGFTHINNPDKRGVVGYDKVTQDYMLEGASGNMWNDFDDFYFLWKKMKGDFILRAEVEFIGKGVDPHRKVGWMVRHSLEPNSPHINAVVHGDGLTSLQFRKTPGAITEQVQSENKAPNVIQLERKGDWYIMSTAKFGEPFVTTHFRDITLGNDVYIGIFLCSHNDEVVEKAIFKNVRIIVPAKTDFVPYRDYIGSHIEVMDIERGHRKILYSEPVSLQAPNWTRDGKSLIYNSNGLLYKLDLQTNQTEKINTDFANRNNNDHVLSFDGKMLGISHHSADDDGKSMVYTVPTTGGIPKKITTLGPSYFHSWSPDGKYLIYTGGRDDQWDIYKIPSKGGKEVKLTVSKGLDDGSEYTPDGKYIYYNSTETGRMQIWRMKSNGTRHEQITNDDYNNWFPHISPDGKWIVFLSYMNDVKPEEHPFYKHVYLKLMPISGGTPKVIAYVYGGQGTINVPSWSPDSKMIAFVSNTEIK